MSHPFNDTSGHVQIIGYVDPDVRDKIRESAAENERTFAAELRVILRDYFRIEENRQRLEALKAGK